MPNFTTNPYYQTQPGNINFAPNSFPSSPMPQYSQMQPQNSGSIMMIQIQSDDEVNTYPVAAGTTVMLINFSTNKFWLKSTSTSGVPEPLRRFNFNEEITQPQTSANAVSREEFESLSQKIDKLIADLGGNNNG